MSKIGGLTLAKPRAATDSLYGEQTNAIRRCAVPKSRVRKKPVYTPPPTKSSARRKVSPPWLAPTMVASLLIGLAWIALYYVTQADMPGLRALGPWNLLCGFGLIIFGVVLATNWR